ncbi:MAG: hypothetical protein RIT43_2380 [Bacteroidota bacterium]|jgi:hypothetical protein
MNLIANLNIKQYNLLNEYVRNGRKEEYVREKMSFFGVSPQYQCSVYEHLIQGNKKVNITELDHEFCGLQVCTEINLNKLMSDGATGDWKINVKRAKACRYLRVFSLTDRSLFFIAQITGFEQLANGKCRILFTNPDFQSHEFRNIKFNRNVVRYINTSTKKSQTKKDK